MSVSSAVAPGSVAAIYEQLQARLGWFAPAAELWYQAELAAQILELKAARNAVILGHNYMEPALFHTVPDYVGDSLELSRRAAATTCDLIVFCGVRFMAETAHILNPDKTVLIPALPAGCSLAESITAEDVRQLRARYPGVPVVAYINTYAEVKAEADICCTSGNAVAVVEALRSDTVIFVPDEYLARNVAEETGRHIIVPTRQPRPHDTTVDYQMIGWHGRCEVHERFSVADIEQARQVVPDVVVLAHPECSPEVVAAADFAGSTSAMLRFVERHPTGRFLLLTECAMGDNIAAAYPDRELVRMCSIRCRHMNQIRLADTLAALQRTQYVVEVAEPVRSRARQAIERMLAIG
jgi:quinolinate synthase